MQVIAVRDADIQPLQQQRHHHCRPTSPRCCAHCPWSCWSASRSMDELYADTWAAYGQADGCSSHNGSQQGHRGRVSRLDSGMRYRMSRCVQGLASILVGRTGIHWIGHQAGSREQHSGVTTCKSIAVLRDSMAMTEWK